MRPIGALLLPAIALIFTLACGRDADTGGPAKTIPTGQASYVGEAACAGCHAEEAKLWQGSHHALAMQRCDPKTVLGNFNNTTFSHFDTTSTFTRKDDRFFIRTDGPDGRLHDYPVEYTFGLDPLQQYLAPFPGGRYQVPSIAWDTRPAAQGGQRWFHLYPDERMPHDDILHWTGLYQNWNYMCADCHSTHVTKGYLASEDRYETTFSEVDVACEACHGPGSEHLAWANSEKGRARGMAEGGMGLVVRLKDADNAFWLMERNTGIAKRSRPRESRIEIETCALCHSRREDLSEEYEFGLPILDTHRVSLLDEDLYYPDGQILGEVYEYGSFLQSKMYAAGVTCHDCHDPHSARPKASGNATCARCHLPGKFDSPSHHHHQTNGAGSHCVECHMPTKNFMVIHARHDHSIRIPRPDLTMKLGTPNACNQCHPQSTAQWAADWAMKWWGAEKLGKPHYGEVIEAGREGLPGVGEKLAALIQDKTQPGIVRGTAASLLGRSSESGAGASLRAALRDPDPFVRMGALTSAQEIAPSSRIAWVAPLLGDPIFTVRIQAARLLAAVSGELSPEGKTRLDPSLMEYRKAQELNADRPENELNLGSLEAELGHAEAAERDFRQAIRLAPGFAPSYVNLADLYRATGRDKEGEAILREGLKAAPRDAALHHSLGLLQIRQKRLREALQSLARAVEEEPRRARFSYVYGVALESSGKMDQAMEVLKRAHEAHPGDRDILAALANFSRKKGDLASAVAYASDLVALSPDDPAARELLEEMKQSRTGS